MQQSVECEENLGNWQPPRWPDQTSFDGRYVRLALLSRDHAPSLHAANLADDAIWDWMPYGPFASESGYADWVDSVADGPDPRFHAIFDKEHGDWGGVASLMRIAPAAGSIEVGHINFAPRLQRTRAATEAMYLLMRWCFEAGYRRYEWKCNALNLGSRRAAQRLGFSYEGVFRQAAVVKGKNRDTAWFACIDKEWPALKAAFETWLSPDNFDADGRQRQSLSDLTAPVRVASDPLLRDTA
ncbi:GNAT family N-acetyltransferase [Psychromarinibacter halotolerans]|uniref:GNAT family N-acetyltransferase n=1 Tax=Psychromarinibacter halotolerans TaxID=1775175 RepID=A0ABV7GUW4_9RHOB|nr:GNAT family protein [Psychromarinibacter halotolerans]MDF0596192.1 GNAT family protein [Psychromarinibacter halotolerans]